MSKRWHLAWWSGTVEFFRMYVPWIRSPSQLHTRRRDAHGRLWVLVGKYTITSTCRRSRCCTETVCVRRRLDLTFFDEETKGHSGKL